MEIILRPDNARYTTFPIRYSDLWRIYKQHQAILWIPEEVKYNEDVDDWNKLTSDEQYFIEHILAFFAGSDGIVMENIQENFIQEVQIPEARSFYALQTYIESVHGHTYSLLIDTFVKDPQRKSDLFKAIDTIPCVTKKANWAKKWMVKDRPFRERLVAFAVVEGLFFSGSFCAIFWLKNRGVMTKALGKSNEWISRDEGLHCDFAIALYKKLKERCSEDVIVDIISDALLIETEFICESLPCRLIGMNSDLMSQYIRFVANGILKDFDCSYQFDDAENPFPFMEQLGIDGKTNFFEQQTSEYQLAYSVTSSSNRSMNFLHEDDLQF